MNAILMPVTLPETMPLNDNGHSITQQKKPPFQAAS